MAKRKTINLDTATKTELRALCKAEGVKGYDKLKNDQMRAALRALIETDPNYQTTGPKKPAPVVTTPAVEPVVLSGKTKAVEQNGVRAPIKGVCRDVWDALDKMRAGGMVPESKQVRDLATASNWNSNNATIELGRWRKFHGLTKPRVVKAKIKAKAAPVARRIDGTVEEYAS